ncbi:MAG TPA: cob(I)yrinic acid a,c-diamide adenosyltransferase [Desulfosarcina sp.]|nr:cob(I)yrinic acid a,c-diamide adenosyltransferase [Desulfosarcina sp.]
MPAPPQNHASMRGCVHVYTGNGKGKTTAALGLCLRALGAGLRVYIGQFMKRGDTSESKALACFGDQVTLVPFGTGRFVRGRPSEEDRQAARQGYASAMAALTGGDFHMVVLDESMVALHLGLLTMEEVQTLLDRRPASVELVLTGRHAPSDIVARADLVTDMHEVKHYYHSGIPARIGIEK